MPESAEVAPEQTAAESPDASGATPAAPAVPTTPKAGASPPRSRSFTVLATVVLAVAVIAVILTARRQGAGQDSRTPDSVAPASRAVTPAPPAAAGPPPVALSPAKWTGSKTPGWATDGSRTITFQLAAERDVPVWMKRVRPVLAVRCLGGTTEVFVITESAASIEGDTGHHTVRVGFDEGADAEQHWTASSDYRALFAPDGEALARRIARSQRMRFAFTPYSAAPVVTAFDVHGFDDLVGSIAKVCRWKP